MDTNTRLSFLTNEQVKLILSTVGVDPKDIKKIIDDKTVWSVMKCLEFLVEGEIPQEVAEQLISQVITSKQ